MTHDPDDPISKAQDYWTQGQPLQAGRILFQNLPPNKRVKWAHHLLSTVVQRTGVTSPPIDTILRISSHRKEWNKGHDASSAAGRFIHSADAQKSLAPAQALLELTMHLAIGVARVTYNESKPDDPFDDDTGWYLASMVNSIAKCLNDDAFTREMWAALCTQ